MCEAKRREENDRWERRARGVRTEEQVWGIVNRERRKRRVNGDVNMGEWEEYFEGLLEGVDNRVVWGEKEDGRGGEEEELSREEIKM